MSTFKVQPVYAELVLGWLDLCRLDLPGVTMSEILSSIRWVFKGGTLGAYPMAFPTPSSQTRYPAGCTLDLSVVSWDNKERVALEALVRRRSRLNRRNTRSMADWCVSFYALRSLLANDTLSEAPWTGMTAVYRLVGRMWNSAAASRGRRRWEKESAYIRECALASAAASHQDIPTAAALCAHALASIERTKCASFRDIIEEYDQAMRYSNSPMARSAARAVGRRLLVAQAPPSDYEIEDLGLRKYRVAGYMAYVGHGWMAMGSAAESIILSRSDIVRVHQMCTSICSGLFATVSQAVIAPGAERTQAQEVGHAYERQVDRIIEAARRVPQGEEVHVCKAFKRAFSAYLGEISGPLCKDETSELWDEVRSTKHVAAHLSEAWVSEIRPWSASTAFNLGKVYKVCPAPDASPALTLIERHEMVTNRNTMQAETMDTFRTILRDQILRAYVRAPGIRLELRDANNVPQWWPSYRKAEFDNVPSDEIHAYLEWEGTAVMPSRSPHDPSVWKDSGLGWDTIEESANPERMWYKGNMLTRMIFDKQCPQPGERHIPPEHSHKIDTKPEGHKDPARGIYSGNIFERLNQSWMEAAVDAVAHYHPAYMIGADAEVRENRLRALTDRTHDPALINLYYSFDISGWSPRMPPEAQRISHMIWAELYDEALFRGAHTINEGARVYMNKHGYTGWFENPGANFEGYNGKEMTMILVALMARVVSVWRVSIVAAGLATHAEASRWATMLLAYIDDGLAKITLPRDRHAALFALFKQTTVVEFRACGYNVEASKCYPSDRFAVFLNEPYLAGRHVVHGTRAAMTICAENTEPHTTLLERTMAVSTGCRGAVMAGLDAMAGTMLQAYHVYQHIREWVRYPDPVASAVWSYLPRAWGGLGLPSAMQLSTSGGGASAEESVYTMQQWSRASAAARRTYLSCARAEMAGRTSMGIMLSPLGGRLKQGPMVDTRVPEAVREALAALAKVASLSALARELLTYSSPESMEDFSSAVLPLELRMTIQEQILHDLASAHPHALFSAFSRRIEKSATLIKLVGFKTVNRLIKQNRRDAGTSYVIVKQRLGLGM